MGLRHTNEIAMVLNFEKNNIKPQIQTSYSMDA